MYRNIETLEMSETAIMFKMNDGRVYSTEFDTHEDMVTLMMNDGEIIHTSNFILMRKDSWVYFFDGENTEITRLYLPHKMWRKQVATDIKKNNIFCLNFRRQFRNKYRIKIYNFTDLEMGSFQYETFLRYAENEAKDELVPSIAFYYDASLTLNCRVFMHEVILLDMEVANGI
jgi:hypothetical protein